MIQFIVANRSVLDPSSDHIVDYIYKQMLHGPALWIEESASKSLVESWCEQLFPRRLLLYQSSTTAITVHGVLHIIEPEQLNLATQDTTIFSRGVLIPNNISYRLLIHWVDDNRETSRECYRAYQQRGLKPQTIQC